MTSARDKVLQYLEEAHATEAALFSILTAHIAMTPRGEYRDLLERHRTETRAQAQRLQQRLTELGASKSLVVQAYGLAQTAVGQTVSLALAPLNLLRGTGGEEKLLKNAKDEASSEMLEIVTYDAIEALAEAVGDEKTAVLAREHRTQEEIFLRQLREVIPDLAQAVVAAEVEGEPSFDVTKTGAADAARAAGAAVKAKAGKAQDGAEQAAATAKATAGATADRARAATSEVKDAAEDVAERVEETAGQVKDEVQDTAGDVKDQVKDTAEDVKDEVKDTAGDVKDEVQDTAGDVAGRVEEAADDVRGEADAARADMAQVTEDEVHAVSGDEPLPIDDYDTLSINAILPKLRTLSGSELARIDGYERAGKERKRILDRVSALRAKRVDEEIGTPVL